MPVPQEKPKTQVQQRHLGHPREDRRDAIRENGVPGKVIHRKSGAKAPHSKETQEGTMYRAPLVEECVERSCDHESGGKPPHSKVAAIGLEVEEAVGGDDQEKGEGGDGDFADGAYSKGAEALFAHFTEVGAEANASEGEEEGPTGEIG